MATTQGQSLRSKQRTNVMHAYRGRGHRNANLWLVYSVKMDRDYLFPSDRHFLHWINYLETNPDVQSFTLEPEEISTADSLKTNTLEFDAKVLLRNGSIRRAKEHVLVWLWFYYHSFAILVLWERCCAS